MVTQICLNEALGAAGSVKTGQSGTPNIASLGSPQLGYPRDLTIGVDADAATTLSFFVSYDNGVTWLDASVRNTSTSAQLTFAAAGGQAIDITPAPYVKIVSSAACHLSAWAYSA